MEIDKASENWESGYDRFCRVASFSWRLVCARVTICSSLVRRATVLASGLYPRCQLVTGITNGFLLINKVSFINDDEERNTGTVYKLREKTYD